MSGRPPRGRGIHRRSATVRPKYNFTSFIGAGGLPTVVGALGNPDFKPETVLDAEAGYRAEIGTVASVDVTVFRASYHNLKTSEPLAPRIELTPAPRHLFIPVQFANLLAATTSGVEIAAHWTPVVALRLDGGFSTFRLTPHLSPASRDATAASFDGKAPRAQWYARSATAISPRVRLDATLFHAGALPKLGVPGYTRLDAQLEMSVTRPDVGGDCRAQPDGFRSRRVRRAGHHRHPDAHSSERISQPGLAAVNGWPATHK